MDHLPNYAADERTRYSVLIEVEGEITALRHMLTLDACQRAYIDLRETSTLGASSFGEGNVFDEMGQHIARISYNGRLWEPLPWNPEQKPLA